MWVKNSILNFVPKLTKAPMKQNNISGGNLWHFVASTALVASTAPLVFTVKALVVAILLLATNPVVARELSVQELEQRKQADELRKQQRLERQKKQAQKPTKKAEQTIVIGLLKTEKKVPPALSNLDPILQDEAIYGARLGVEDNNTTGAFTNQLYKLTERFVKIGEDPLKAFSELKAQGVKYIIADVDKQTFAKLDPSGVLVFNPSLKDNELRNELCHRNVFHTIPSRAMEADALTQFLVKKNWKRAFIIYGPTEADAQVKQSLQRALKRFGAKAKGDKKWDLTHDLRRTAKSEVPVFTKGLGRYDILLLADEKGEFGEYFVWHTWEPKLIAGTQGLIATAWHRTHEQWGATQMQNRFRREASRWMTQVDYAAWVATRSIGEVLTRLKDASLEEVRDYLTSPKFGIAAYKGLKVSYRKWNNQLRQRVLLATPRSLVSHSPQEGFLHPQSDLDTLGFDKGESKCKF